MGHENAWVFNGSQGAGAPLIPKGSRFWLHAVNADGSPAYFTLHDPTDGMNHCFKNRKLYPVGVNKIQVDRLTPWKDGDPAIAQEHMGAAIKVRNKGRSDPLAARLEGTFTVGSNLEVVRIYCFPGQQKDGRDWMVFDIISNYAVQEDGTGHGDPPP
jgi:hypothetical protein